LFVYVRVVRACACMRTFVRVVLCVRCQVSVCVRVCVHVYT